MNDRLMVEDFLRHMLEASERIKRYTRELTKQKFLEDELIQDAVLRNISIFGEAVSNIRREYPEFVKAHSDIPWQLIYGMRNRVIHDYLYVDLESVWQTIKKDIPELEKQLLKLLEQA
jgi:uncharacterized protein with HEPN domain